MFKLAVEAAELPHHPLSFSPLVAAWVRTFCQQSAAPAAWAAQMPRASGALGERSVSLDISSGDCGLLPVAAAVEPCRLEHFSAPIGLSLSYRPSLRCVGGCVFQGRYKAIAVEKNAHLLESARYVVLEPVRARMVHTPGEWPWNSYRAMVGETDLPEWLEIRRILTAFSETGRQAAERYARFVA